MATALKCDRCKNYFDYDPEVKFNFIAFGHKDIIVGKNFPVKDICPNCMEQFTKWFENPDNYDPQDLVKNIAEEYDNETTKKLCYFEYCKDCLSLFRKSPLPGETGYSEVRCGRWHTGIPMRGADPKLIDSITPDMFIKEEGYKDPCESCHNGKCEQCIYGYCSEEEKKNRWLGNHRKKNVGDDDERVNNLYKEAEEISNNAGDTKEEEK